MGLGGRGSMIGGGNRFGGSRGEGSEKEVGAGG